MSNLPEVGARAVVENMPKFQAAMDAVNRALDTGGQKAETAAKRSGVLEKAYARLATAASGVAKATGSAMNTITGAVTGMATKVVAGIGTVVSIIAVALVAAIGVAIAAVGSLVGALAALSNRGAAYEGVIDSFERLTAGVQVSANALLVDLRSAARGTIPDMELLRLTNLALAGATGEAGKLFGESLPKLLEIARAQARATGQDVNYLYESLITGIKRGSPLLIDNTGLMLKIGEANQAYADSLGITVEQMSAQDQQIALLNATLEAGERALATYGNAQETLAEKTARAQASITNILDYLSLGLQPVARAFMDAFNGILTNVAGFLQQAIPYIQAIGMLIVNAIKPFLQQISGVAEQLNSPGAARAFFTGAMNTFGSFLRGVVLAGAQIVQAVAQIANAIADFLLGFSPPKKGPLSRIDEGGANVMMAWLDGFLGAFSLDPVEQVARQVADALGPIAGMALAQVEARLAQLDAAIKPFQDRLAIVKADFDAITKIGELAIKGVERQLTAAVQALLKGEAGSGELVRKLDAQRQAIEDTLAAQQQQTEEYELQLAIAEAMQARERALLNIRKAQLPTLQAVATAADKTRTASGATAKPPKEGTGSGGELPSTGGGAAAGGTAIEDLFGLGTDPAKIKNISEELAASFGEGFGDAGDIWATATGALTKGGNRLEDAFSGLGGRIQQRLEDAFSPIALTVQKHLLAAQEHVRLFTETTIPEFFGSLPTRIGTALLELGNQLELYLVAPIRDKINTYIAPLFADSATPGSIAYFFAQIPVQIEAALATLGEWINTYLVLPVQEKIADVQTAFDTFFHGEGEGSLRWIFDQAIAFLATVPGLVGDALRPVAQFVLDTFVAPIVNAINAVLGGFETLVNALRDIVVNFGRQAADFLGPIGQLGGPFAMLGVAADSLRQSADLMRSLPRLSVGRVAQPTIGGGMAAPAAARGGIFGPGALRVHRGEELIASSARQLTVFPARVVRALEAVASVTPRTSAYVHPSVVNNSSNVDNSQTYGDMVFNGIRDGQDVMGRLAMLRAWR